MHGDIDPPENEISWDKAFRVIPSRYPPIDLFERIADPSEWELLAEIESVTNERLRDEVGLIHLVPPEDRVVGPGASPIMAAFTHLGFPSRFTDGSYGVYYASDQEHAALAEVIYHKETFLRRTNEPPTRVEMRMYFCAISARLHDVRDGWADVHDPISYGTSQNVASRLRAQGSNGIVYNSVRCPQATNIAVFRPRVLASNSQRPHTTQGAHFFLQWDGEHISKYIKVGDSHWQPANLLCPPSNADRSS